MSYYLPVPDLSLCSGQSISGIYPSFHFKCYTVDSSDFWPFRGQNPTIHMGVQHFIISVHFCHIKFASIDIWKPCLKYELQFARHHSYFRRDFSNAVNS